MPKFTFKKEPKETGLASVGNPYQAVAIKHNKQVVGMIYPPSWFSDDRKWSISFMVKKEIKKEENCSWGWVRLKAKFGNEQLAREFVTAKASSILCNFKLHHQVD